jgi:glycosyltransferase involved in cell wall biosynthesis
MTRLSVLELVASSRGGGAVHVRDLALALDATSPAHPATPPNPANEAGRSTGARSAAAENAGQSTGNAGWSTEFAVQVAMADDGGTVSPGDFAAAGIPCHRLDIAAGFSLPAIGRLRRLLNGVDLMHVHGARAALFGRLAALSLGRQRPRVIYSIHGFAAPHYPSPRRQALLAVEHALAPITDLWICVSHAEKEALLTAGVADAQRVHVIWNGIDIQRFADLAGRGDQVRSELQVPTEAFVVTTVCRLFRPRDFETLLYAFRQVLDRLSGAHLLIVGDGPLRPQVEGLVTSLHLENHAHLLGMRRDVPQILRATDVLVLSSKSWEGLPLTVLEAMASSLPVVASDVGGTREAIVDGETGLLFPPGDAAALAYGILSLAGDPLWAQQMGQRGRARVREHFTFQRMARETAALYEQLLSSPRIC